MYGNNKSMECLITPAFSPSYLRRQIQHHPPIAAFENKTYDPSILVSLDGGGPIRLYEEVRKQKWLDDALKTAETMQKQGISISKEHVYGILQECSKQKCLRHSRKVQFLIIHTGMNSFPIFSDQLIRLFTVCERLVEANAAFNEISVPSLYTWSAIITTHARLGEGEIAFILSDRMLMLASKGNKYVYLAVLKACTFRLDIFYGRLIHNQIIKDGIHLDVVIGNTVTNMYAKCGSLDEAVKAFAEIPDPDVSLWTVMITGFVQHSEGILALNSFEDMQIRGILLDKAAFLSILKACGAIGNIAQGRRIHELVVGSPFQADIIVGNALIDMYFKCGSLEEAYKVFVELSNKDVVSWSAMIIGYAEHGEGLSALGYYRIMQHSGIRPDKFTFSSVLKACGKIGAIRYGRHIHNQIVSNGLHLDLIISNSLIDMYAKCGSLGEAHEVFNKLTNRNVVSWGAMVGGYALQDEGFLALICFEEMQQEDVKPNEAIYLSVLKACAKTGAIGFGRRIHEQIIESELSFELSVGNTLIDMYTKCGSLNEAGKVFKNLVNRDVVSWDAMIFGYAQLGNLTLTEQCLQAMQQGGINPSKLTFTSIFSACSHTGLVGQGQRYFKSMREIYGVTPDIYHCNCMVDLLSRAGYLMEAYSLLQTVKMDIIGWTSLLTACRTYGNVQLGSKCFDHIRQLDPFYAAAYVIMSGIYSDACMWRDAAKIEELRQCSGAWKKPAKAWIEVNNTLHEFSPQDKTHPQINEISLMLRRLTDRMKDEGYIPEIDLVLRQISTEEKEDILSGHCEKLAIAFGLLSTPGDTIIRVTKNLRICTDCHKATKLISRTERREIIIRDSYRIHHFSYGSCSCGDYY